jgi:Transposase, Mutator family
LEPLVRTPGTAACSTPSHLLPNGTTDGPCVTPATSYLLGVSTRRMEKLVQQLGINRLSKSQVSVMAKDLNAQVKAFRTRPLDAGPYTFLAADTLTMKVREAGRVVNVACLVASGVNATATVRSSAWRSAQLSLKPAGCSSSAA